ncbi:pyrimidine utilization flavin reductase protein F [Pseudomonas savastanoi pv. retacarpa]|uniref:FMN reductase (NADH) RutF n=3 Tax=Pseudomonas savastanoi TaxID=29438 RepID=A0AB73RK80_PSESS|nr:MULTISPECIES: pyrimidine utilization flavin reductase protein F [Pseudomonas]ARD11141.1 pyrimidine utilization flavin reductase protein F [Pseudomonas savastanoi pv. savastanoi NCPPB 3335]EGH03162.1 4-hydroxyphenylacetate 3-monooxygenase, reductase component [Pseudomonas amygdali pv. aesculi str. 0893_23]KAA3547760.1 pyrimidine utilization flavin reductase protein F [Pseudomonas savastanoi]KPB63295.1 FMN reductase NADH RutF [Pseudomonas amygdali pv. myricae]KPC55810.1 FMN reductase NADH Rut
MHADSETLATLPAAPVSQLAFRDAMSSLAAAVNVITTDGPGGRAGFTATAVCSVTDQPPTLLVCINRSASVYETFIENGLLCVNTLGNGQQDLSNLFGGKRSQQERFDGGQWESGVTGAPILNSAKLALDCKVTQSVSVGTHDILFCQVLDIRHQGESDALVYFARQYHHLPGAAPAA